MLDDQKFLTVAAFVKWINAEPLAKEDVERVLNILQKNELRISLMDEMTRGGIQVRIRQILNERFGGPPAQ